MEHGAGEGYHRPLWVDITKVSALGSKRPDIPTHKARRLKCRDPRIVARYNKLLEGKLQKERFFIRLNRLYTIYSNPLNEDQINELK